MRTTKIYPADDYYRQRATELFNPQFNHQDTFVSREEIEGILEYIERATDNKGRFIFEKTEIEHNFGMLGIHPTGSQKIPHLNIKLRNANKQQIGRHLIVLDDPQDIRLNTIGFKDLSSDHLMRTPSKVYIPNHPSYTGKQRIDGIHLTFQFATGAE